jgi:two-component system, NtrC family, nitrogen regulation sensor histidine kinase NtrY
MQASVKKAFLLLLLGAVCIALAPMFADLARPDVDPIKSAQKFAQVLDDKTSKAHRSIDYIRHKVRSIGAKHTQFTQHAYLEGLHEEHGIAIFVFRNDELILWSSNTISPLSAKRSAALGREIHRFENGWYRLLYLTDGIEEYIAAVRIKHTYPYQNSYLSNGFAPGFDVAGVAGIDVSPKGGDVKLQADHQYFYLSFEQAKDRKLHSHELFILSTIAGGILVLLGVFLLFDSRNVSRALGGFSFFVFAAVVILLRLWSIHAGWPGYVANHSWFDPSIYASSEWFPSMADFLINLSVIALLAFAGRYHFLNKPQLRRSPAWMAPLLFALLFALAYFSNHLLKGLVLNSNIPFDINVITRLNAFSLLGICGSALMYFSFFLLADSCVIYLHRRQHSATKIVISFLLMGALHIVLAHYLGVRDLIFVLWPILVVAGLIYMRIFTNKHQLRLGHAVMVILLFAAVSAHNFIKYSYTRERNQRNILVERQVLNQDPVAELLYSGVRKELARDRNVRRVFEENELHTRQLIEGYIIQRYFTGYWGNYDVEIYPFLGDSSAWGKLMPNRPEPFSTFLRRAAQQGEVTSADSTLFNIYERREVTSYLGIIPLHYNLLDDPDGFFVVLFSAKQFGQQSGFPALLVDAKTGSSIDKNEDYSTAKYVDGLLRNKSGEFNYKSTATSFLNLGSYPGFVAKQGYDHLVSKTDENTVIVISKPLITLLDKATVLSYLCAIFGILFVLGRGLRKRWLSGGQHKLNLNEKIQLLLIMLTLTSMVLFAWATMFYIEENYSEKNRGQVKEKMQSILREVQEQLNDEEELHYGIGDYLNGLLSQLAFVFYTDIHLFAPDGELLGSSQIRMFNEGLVSRQMNPAAFANLSYVRYTQYLHEERIGALEYISAYIPIYNKQGVLLGYLNLPYFARQAELEQEIGSFLETVINIFVLLFIISIFIGLFISQWITAPLRVIRESLSAVELGKANRILGYSGQDEIGLLVAEYNAKVAELENNAEKLAQGERESAWREMAKQVAHEIKNPSPR